MVQQIDPYVQIQGFFRGTQAAIEALTGLSEGCVGYATDINQLGYYNGVAWQWIDATAGSPVEDQIFAAPNDNFADADFLGFVDVSDSNALKKITGANLRSVWGNLYYVRLDQQSNWSHLGADPAAGVAGTMKVYVKSTGLFIRDSVLGVVGPMASQGYVDTGDAAVTALIPTTEQIQDIVGGMVSGAGVGTIIVIYNDTTGQLEFSLANEDIQDIVGAMFSGNTETGITASYDDTNGKIDLVSLAREKLTAARTYYVRTDGSDSNNGLANTAGGAFLTIQKAINVVAGIDLDIYDVTIQVADGTYTGAVVVNGPWVGAGTVTIQGNSGTPANVLINVTGDAITSKQGARIHLKDFEVRSTGNGSLVASNGYISFTNLRFGTATNQHLRAVDGGIIECTGNYTISGGAANHWVATGLGGLRCQSKTITLSGTPAFSGGFAVASQNGFMIVNGNTFSGSATGQRYNALLNGVINTVGGGATYLPGDSAGTTSTGGQYA